MSERAPEASELVYVPGPSWLPALTAAGLAGVLVGVFVWWPYAAIGGAIALTTLWRLLRAAGEGVERLPRRQEVTTAVLPAVPPRKPE